MVGMGCVCVCAARGSVSIRGVAAGAAAAAAAEGSSRANHSGLERGDRGGQQHQQRLGGGAGRQTQQHDKILRAGGRAQWSRGGGWRMADCGLRLVDDGRWTVDGRLWWWVVVGGRGLPMTQQCVRLRGADWGAELSRRARFVESWPSSSQSGRGIEGGGSSRRHQQTADGARAGPATARGRRLQLGTLLAGWTKLVQRPRGGRGGRASGRRGGRDGRARTDACGRSSSVWRRVAACRQQNPLPARHAPASARARLRASVVRVSAVRGRETDWVCA